MDLWMPEMGGWRFLEERQRLTDSALAAVPVVILTAGLDCEKKARGIGAVAFLRKSIDLDRVMDIVRRFAAAEV
jgi:CheY-like chemotaxis protein